jgi:hypothetical protein
MTLKTHRHKPREEFFRTINVDVSHFTEIAYSIKRLLVVAVQERKSSIEQNRSCGSRDEHSFPRIPKKVPSRLTSP